MPHRWSNSLTLHSLTEVNRLEDTGTTTPRHTAQLRYRPQTHTKSYKRHTDNGRGTETDRYRTNTDIVKKLTQNKQYKLTDVRSITLHLHGGLTVTSCVMIATWKCPFFCTWTLIKKHSSSLDRHRPANLTDIGWLIWPTLTSWFDKFRIAASSADLTDLFNRWLNWSTLTRMIQAG